MARPTASTPSWLGSLLKGNAILLTSASSFDGHMSGATWFVKFDSQIAAEQVEKNIFATLAKEGFQEHPAGKLTGAQSTLAQRKVKHLSAPGGKQLALTLKQTDGATLAVFTEYFPKRQVYDY
jgi:hypothetical protein